MLLRALVVHETVVDCVVFDVQDVLSWLNLWTHWEHIL